MWLYIKKNGYIHYTRIYRTHTKLYINWLPSDGLIGTPHTHTHTRIYIYIFIFVHICDINVFGERGLGVAVVAKRGCARQFWLLSYIHAHKTAVMTYGALKPIVLDIVVANCVYICTMRPPAMRGSRSGPLRNWKVPHSRHRTSVGVGGSSGWRAVYTSDSRVYKLKLYI